MTGHVLRSVRDALGRTQEQLAETLGVDLNTLKAWETGRRPLQNASSRTLVGVRRQLLRLGAPHALIRRLDTAMEVDLFIDDVLTEGDASLLETWVTTRDWNDLLCLMFAHDDFGRPLLALPADDRTRFLSVLRSAAERSFSAGDERGILLRRQVYFVAAWDLSSDGRSWMVDIAHAETQRARVRSGWTPAWVSTRSLAVARSCQGDPDLLRGFIARQLADEACEAANLNYWAYWIGEDHSPATADTFMAGADLGAWRGTTLLRHLAEQLAPGKPYLDLSAHSLHSLVQRRSFLLGDDSALTADLGHRVTRLLDSGPDLSVTTRRELEQVYFATRMAGDLIPRRTNG